MHPAILVVLALTVLTALAAFSPARATPAPLAAALAATLVVQSADGADRFLGSAFLWGDDGLALTAAHVTGGAAQVRVVWPDGRTAVVAVIAADAVRDIAVLDLGPNVRGGLRAGPPPVAGQTVHALGAPLGAAGTVTRGIVSALARQVEAAVPMRLLQHDAAVNPGSSGGPLVDAAGQLVGMNVRIADGSRLFAGIAYAIPAADLDRLVLALIDGTLPPVPRLGMQARAVTRRIAAALGAAGGVLVDHVEPGGMADRAGLRAGDVIVEVGRAAVADPGALAFALDAAGAAQGVALTVQRGRVTVALWLAFAAPEARLGTLRGGEAQTEAPTLAGLGVSLDPQGRVTAVAEHGAARAAGLARGDLVLLADGLPFDDDLAGRPIRGALLLLVRRGAVTLHVLIDPAAAPGWRPVAGANVLDPDVVVF
jgi:serine protease Do